MGFALLIDVILLVLLCITLFYGIRLSRQMSEIREDQARLEGLISSLNSAADRADTAINNMRTHATETSEKLQSQISKGQAIFDELDIMIEAGDSLAERLQKIAEDSRKAVDTKKSSKAAKKSESKKADKKDSKKKSRAEEELIAALGSKK